MIGMIIILSELAMLLTGLTAVIIGRFPYRTGRPVTGLGAYVGGIIMMLPFVIGIPANYAMHDRSIQDHGEAVGSFDFLGKWIIFHSLMIVICFFGSYFAAALLYNPMGSASKSKWLKEVQNRKRRRRKKDLDDDEDDRPRRRRRRREEEDYDDAPPRRRPPPEDDDDYDPPPRRARYDDEEEDDRRRRRHYEDDEDELPPRRRHAGDDDDLRHSHRSGPPPLPRG